MVNVVTYENVKGLFSFTYVTSVSSVFESFVYYLCGVPLVPDYCPLAH